MCHSRSEHLRSHDTIWACLILLQNRLCCYWDEVQSCPYSFKSETLRSALLQLQEWKANPIPIPPFLVLLTSMSPIPTLSSIVLHSILSLVICTPVSSPVHGLLLYSIFAVICWSSSHLSVYHSTSHNALSCWPSFADSLSA